MKKYTHKILLNQAHPACQPDEHFLGDMAPYMFHNSVGWKTKRTIKSTKLYPIAIPVFVKINEMEDFGITIIKPEETQCPLY